ncbi:tyrosine-protein phosphatase [Streptacidiphilus albus]|uniref:tyrosine-protein phosphatase n=1 Tax=Streptacidiphilus albus TaxID=105425 RepID=UPI000AA0BD80|nr:tyrosine-protein phosphatase [Streptacidiphilus albus]
MTSTQDHHRADVPVVDACDRDLRWEGSFNVRDLGGIRTAGGGETRWGAVVRSDSIDGLTAAGWAALQAHGIRTIIDLRNEGTAKPSLPRPEGIDFTRVPLDALVGKEWWDEWGHLDGTPLFLRPHLELRPHAAAAAVTAVARAQPGGVLVHCGAGRDRTGLVALVLLALARVAPEDIAADYELSASRLAALWAHLGRADEQMEVDRILAREGTTAREALVETLTSFDPEACLLAAGLGADDLATVRARLRPSE